MPDFDGPSIFGALLDLERGGFCRFAPRGGEMGRQRYLPGTAVLVTAWNDAGSGVDTELADVMAWPECERPEDTQGQRVIIRRMRAPKTAEVRFELFPKLNFHGTPEESRPWANGARFGFVQDFLGLWTSFPFQMEPDGASAVFHMRGGEEHWAVLGWNAPPTGWSVADAADVFQEAANDWREWSADLKLNDAGTRSATLHRSALTVQLLSHAHDDSAVAALTYRLDGDPHMEQEEVEEVCGYESSLPVHRGNRAAKQMQLGSLEFSADCTRIYLDHGGEWEKFWDLLRRAADFTCAHWQEEDCGVWELTQKAHHVAWRVASRRRVRGRVSSVCFLACPRARQVGSLR